VSAVRSRADASGEPDDRHAPRLTIGEVLNVLREGFPDVSISKIRYLESEDLVHPQRTPSGYRKFSSADVARLRYVLAAQRDQYLPLRVIKEHLEALDRGEPLPGSTPRRQPPPEEEATRRPDPASSSRGRRGSRPGSCRLRAVRAAAPRRRRAGTRRPTCRSRGRRRAGPHGIEPRPPARSTRTAPSGRPGWSSSWSRRCCGPARRRPAAGPPRSCASSPPSPRSCTVRCWRARLRDLLRP
jgi:DNA-binding transcriptional MerR regulator